MLLIFLNGVLLVKQNTVAQKPFRLQSLIHQHYKLTVIFSKKALFLDMTQSSYSWAPTQSSYSWKDKTWPWKLPISSKDTTIESSSSKREGIGRMRRFSAIAAVIAVSWIRLRKSDPRGGEGWGSPQPALAHRDRASVPPEPPSWDRSLTLHSLSSMYVCVCGQRQTCSVSQKMTRQKQLNILKHSRLCWRCLFVFGWNLTGFFERSHFMQIPLTDTLEP